MISHGFAYHHSGLSGDERETIERCFWEGLIKCLISTSTLAAGVNLPAKWVIIASLKIGWDDLGTASYKQMIGRAGRFGLDTSGDSVMIVKECEKFKAWSLLKRARDNLEPVWSCLSSVEWGMRKIFLDAICSKLVTNERGLEDFLRCSLLYK